MSRQRKAAWGFLLTPILAPIVFFVVLLDRHFWAALLVMFGGIGLAMQLLTIALGWEKEE